MKYTLHPQSTQQLLWVHKSSTYLCTTIKCPGSLAIAIKSLIWKTWQPIHGRFGLDAKEGIFYTEGNKVALIREIHTTKQVERRKWRWKHML